MDQFSPSPEMASMLAATVGVCVPTGPFMHSRTAFCLQCQSIESAWAGIKEMPHCLEGADPAQARNDGARRLLQHGVDRVLFIDSDMEFPSNSMLRLIRSDLDIVGADYRRRGYPFDRLGKFDDTMPQKECGMVERLFIGFGLFMVKAHVLRSMPLPWFERRYEGEGCMTEDVIFCEKARRRGFRVWADLDLSKEVKHIGNNYVGWESIDYAYGKDKNVKLLEDVK